MGLILNRNRIKRTNRWCCDSTPTYPVTNHPVRANTAAAAISETGSRTRPRCCRRQHEKVKQKTTKKKKKNAKKYLLTKNCKTHPRFSKAKREKETVSHEATRSTTSVDPSIRGRRKSTGRKKTKLNEEHTRAKADKTLSTGKNEERQSRRVVSLTHTHTPNAIHLKKLRGWVGG